MTQNVNIYVFVPYEKIACKGLTSILRVHSLFVHLPGFLVRLERGLHTVPIISWWRHQMETFFTLLAIVRGFHWSPVNSPHKGQWRGALMFSLICAWINVWVNNGEAGDVRRHRAHYDVIVMYFCIRTRLSGHLPWFNEFCSFTKTRHLWNSRAELFENTFFHYPTQNPNI